MGSAGGPFLGQVYTEAESNIDDVTITGPGAPGAMVTGTVTLPFKADFSGIYETLPFGNSGFSGGLQFGAGFVGTNYQANFTAAGNSGGDTYTLAPALGATWTLSAVPTYDVNLVTVQPAGVGAIHNDDWAITGSLVLTQMFPVNTAFTIGFDVVGNCGGGGGNSQITGSCGFDALDPWGFIPGFSSFDLPNGYSVDAPSIGLVNGVVPGSSPVPEPSPLTLFASGLMLLGAFARMRRSRRL